MSKKHFIALADALRDVKPQDPNEDGIGLNTAMQREARMNQWHETCARLAEFCRRENSQFMTSRWFGYIDGTCGSNGGQR